ncbi:MAG: multicopper oxidase domain-containing protein [Acidimicrobiia bacterium]|nr:multicopper oxidase domain-containing protein [Acidimicrobiia bacterium]NNC43633.1 multicopper oxidase domain-containing protein [Acidimicrobiia bacterium]NNL27295.1 multicopper oxidase domain-containing protein [Acidimicrobiia bacterium]
MVQTLDRPVVTEEERRPEALPPEPPPPHPHYTLGSVAVIGVLVGVVGVVLAIGSLWITAGRNSVDDDLVSQKVDSLLAETQLVTGLEAGTSIIPELTPVAQLQIAPSTEVNTAYAPNMPPPSGRNAQAIIEVNFEVVEGVVTIDPETGTEYETWGYKIDGDSNVVAGTPGPVIRGRVGDVFRFTLTNPVGNTHPHNVDFHAVTGQGGGAADTVVAPGETKTIEGRLLYPGFFMYHCAYGDVPLHISHGMYGGILVDPADPLPEVEHEFYMVQSEYYTDGTGPGLVGTDRQAITDENPSHVVFNGAVGALAGDNALKMAVGETARIYFVNAGLNLDSNFHPIGSHWDAVYQEAALINQPLRGSQTTLVPAGGGTVVELIGQVPQTVVLVDHALARTFDKGALGLIVIEGDANPEIFSAGLPEPEVGAEPEPAPAAGPTVSILPGSGDLQPMDSPDEFSANESAPDYSENVLRVKVGTTVTWTQDDTAMIHTVTSVDGIFDSGFMNPGDTWSYTFDEPGEFEYLCTPHPWMRAKVIVEA